MGYGNSGNNGYNNDSNLVCHMSKYIGQTVTIFTTSGGASGCGFTGVLMFVNPCYCRLSSKQGTPPANPLSQSICPRERDWDRDRDDRDDCNHHDYDNYNVGSVVDIPIDRIAAFCHNAV